MDFVESSRLELKEVINSDFKKEIVAFANTDGGDIYVGVSDRGEIVGVEDTEKEMERISSMIHDGIHPDLIPFTTVEKVIAEGKELIHVNVSRGGRLPYHLTDKGLKPSGVYVRHGVVSVPASEEMIRDMIRQSDGITFDKARSINQELTFAYASSYFARREVPFERSNMRSLGLIDADGYYTNAALLFSDQCEHNVKCAVFEGTGKTQFKSRKEFSGSVLKQLEDAYEYIDLLNHVRADFDRLERVDHFDYPKCALREALLNAIVHRDYNYSGSIIINIYSDRIEFVSLGGLVKGITLGDIMHGISQSRNTLVAGVFYRLRLIESYGTGIQRIMESYPGETKPAFLAEAASFVTVLPNLYTNRKPKIVYEITDNSVTLRERQVLDLLAEKKTITRKDVEKLLGCSSFPARNTLNVLLKQNKIRTEAKGRATKYVINEPEE